MTAPLDDATIRRAKSAAALLASDKEGERLAAWAALARVVPHDALLRIVSTGLASIGPKPVAGELMPWRRTARAVLDSGLKLSDWERSFLAHLLLRRKSPTPKQRESLEQLASALSEWEAAHA